MGVHRASAWGTTKRRLLLLALPGALCGPSVATAVTPPPYDPPAFYQEGVAFIQAHNPSGDCAPVAYADTWVSACSAQGPQLDEQWNFQLNQCRATYFGSGTPHYGCEFNFGQPGGGTDHRCVADSFPAVAAWQWSAPDQRPAPTEHVDTVQACAAKPAPPPPAPVPTPVPVPASAVATVGIEGSTLTVRGARAEPLYIVVQTAPGPYGTLYRFHASTRLPDGRFGKPQPMSPTDTACFHTNIGGGKNDLNQTDCDVRRVTEIAIRLGGGNDKLEWSSPPYALPATVDGGGGNDHLWGSPGVRSVLIGGPGNDYLHGGVGPDQPNFPELAGTAGSRFEGGEGNDLIYIFKGAGASAVAGGDGDDFIVASRDASGAALSCGAGFDQITLLGPLGMPNPGLFTRPPWPLPSDCEPKTHYELTGAGPRSIADARRHGVTVGARCSAACTLYGRFSANGVEGLTARASRRSPGRLTVRFRPTPAQWNRIMRAGPHQRQIGLRMVAATGGGAYGGKDGRGRFTPAGALHLSAVGPMRMIAAPCNLEPTVREPETCAVSNETAVFGRPR